MVTAIQKVVQSWRDLLVRRYPLEVIWIETVAVQI
jgi:hypothetical protein